MSPKAMAESWVRLLSQADSTAFANLFEEAIVYEDAAFGIRRNSPAEMKEHHRVWLA